MKKRFLVILLTIVSVLTLTSCSKKFTVSFDLNGGTGDFAAQEVKKGSTATSPSTDPVKDGYSFEGWYNGSTKFKFTTEITEDITLTAKWKELTYTVTFNANGGSSVASQQIKHNGNATQPTTTRKGYDFVEWQLNGTKFDFSTAITSNITLTAAWKQQADAEFVTITFDVNGGELSETTMQVVKDGVVTANELPTPTRSGYTFVSWQLDGEEFTSTTATGNFTLVAKWKSTTYQPNWQPNQQTNGWTGNGMVYKILVKPTTAYDPYSTNYSGTNQKIKQRQQNLVEAKYDIVIKYEEWSSAWGPDRVTDIKNSVSTGSWEYNETLDSSTGEEKGGVYAITVTSSWLPSLVKSSSLVELYNLNTESGIFANVGYEEVVKNGETTYIAGTYDQNSTINQAVSVNSKIYGYSDSKAHPDHFLYYNADKIAELGLTDPAELWFKGEWTWSTFTDYCKNLQAKLDSNSKALAVGCPEFFIGASAASGNPIATASPASLNLTTTKTFDILNKISDLYKAGYYEVQSNDVPASFLSQQSVIVSGSLWFLNDSTRFDPAKCTFTIGAVPYPTDNNQGGTPVTTTDASADNLIYGYDGDPIEDENGNYITGLDLTNSTFKVPYTTTECYSIVNFKTQKNGITHEIAFAILYDLNSGLGEDPDAISVSEEEAYRNSLMKKFNNNSLYVDAIMSVDKCTYYELIESVSATVGGGSQWQGNALWTSNGISAIIKGTKTASDQLNAIVDEYREAMKNMGYAV